MLVHFNSIYTQMHSNNLEAQLHVLNHYPIFFSEEDNGAIIASTFVAEVKEAIKFFEKDKSLGPDGCTIKIFLYFFNVFREEL